MRGNSSLLRAYETMQMKRFDGSLPNSPDGCYREGHPRDRLDFNPSASRTGLAPRLLFSFINEDYDTHPDQDRSTSNGRERPLTIQNIKTRFRVM